VDPLRAQSARNRLDASPGFFLNEETRSVVFTSQLEMSYSPPTHDMSAMPQRDGLTQRSKMEQESQRPIPQNDTTINEPKE
jgi:hypothetical protein